jgi:hypothetical protein
MSKKPLLTLLSSAALSAVAALSVPITAVDAAPSAESKAEAKKYSNNLYIVRMADAPVVTYDGSVKGYAATKPRKGDKIDPYSPQVSNYKSYLESRQDAALARVGGRKVYSYGYAFSGFAAELTQSQADALKSAPGVISVTKDEIRQPDTATTPAFLGLNAPGGLWQQLSGSTTGVRENGPNSSGAGEGIVVGIVDSGIWPENPSFSDRDSGGKLVYLQLPGWHGKCVPGERFVASNCNQKVIGARYYTEGFGGPAEIKESFPYEFISPRGASSHGSHTASTAAGNHGVDALVNGNSLGRVSGMAPRARIAVYKVCWGIGDEGGCPNSDSVAAIDQAVADGVDVLNFSISGSRTSFLDPVEVAFLFAADAGVFVATSAGNNGPGASTVAHNSPWLTTVAAGSHDRAYVATVTLGNGATYTGAGLGAAVPSSPLIAASDAGLAGANPTEVSLCFSAHWTGDGPVLDPAKVAGKIVVCDRGTSDRVDKSLAVKEAGGVGMILANTSANTLNADLHSVPTVHVQNTDRAPILAYAATPGPTASLSAGVGGTGALAPDVAAFSSRGPALAGAGDLLKPDLMAPGVDILAAVSPVENSGRSFDFLSGTSMSSPHVAGLGALMKQLHPDWSPVAIKSALMTSASQLRNNGSAIPGNPFGFGAGQVVPNSAADPGLVYDSGFNDWLGFLCGSGQLVASYCPLLGIDPSDLNYASIAIGDLAGSQTVKRTVKNVGSQAETYTAQLVAPTGTTASVTPASFTLAPGRSQEFTVTVTTTTATPNAYVFGSLTWAGDKGHSVRSPIAVRPVSLAAPASVSSTGGNIKYDVTFGYTGSFGASPRGLVLPSVTPGSVAQDPDQTFDPAVTAGTVAIPVVIPAGSTYARFALFDADVAANTDLDLYVYQGSTLVGSSTSGTSAETVNFSFTNPAAAPINLTVYVHGWGVPAGTSPFSLNQWSIGTAAAGNMTVVAPSSATLAAKGTIEILIDPALGAGRWLGSIVYTGSTGMPTTIVNVTK